MKIQLVLAAVYLCCTPCLSGQNQAYKDFVRSADSLFHAGNYRASADAFSSAFAALGGKAYAEDRFLAARAWARAGVADSVFFHLNRLLDKTDFLSDPAVLLDQTDFSSLHNDWRWERLLNQQRLKLDRVEAIRSAPLTIELENMYDSDQWYRVHWDSVIALHGRNSPEFRDFLRRNAEQDSLNVLRVSALLDSLGWLGPDDVGDKGSRALFLVVQHADLAVQEKYLPKMQQAVRSGKARPSDLAYLEDRVLMRQGKPQRYGSQIVPDPQTGAWILYEVEQPDEIDRRRATVGLGPIQEYLDMTGAVWKH